MSNGFPFVDIIFFAAVALFIAFRLRSVLGRRTGNERRRSSPSEPPSGPTTDNVVNLPPRGAEQNVEDAFQDIDDPELRAGLQSIKAVDPGFELEPFLGGVRGAFEMIVNAFAAGDKEALQPLLRTEVYEGFVAAIEAREEAGEALETRIVAVRDIHPTHAALYGDIAEISVAIKSEQINVTRNAQGEVIEGDPEEVNEVADVWTFARSVASDDPNWELVATDAGG